MGKESGNNNRMTTRSNKPYDVSHSFVRKVANRVSGYLGSFWSSQEQESGEAIDDEPSPGIRSDDVAFSGTNFSANTNSISVSSSLSSQEITRPSLLLPSSSIPKNQENRFKLEGKTLDVTILPSTSGCRQARSERDATLDISNIPGPSGFRQIQSERSRTFEITNIAGPSGFGQTQSDRNRMGDISSAAGPSGFRQTHNANEPTRRSKMARLDEVGLRRREAGDGSDSSESTSGCSSLVPQTDRMSQSALPAPPSRRKSFAIDEKLTYVRQLKQSRAASLQLNRSIPVGLDRLSRTPTFDVSAYGNPIHNKSVKDQMLSSPFYSGHTTYGGASARRSSLGNSFLNTSASRHTFNVRPAESRGESLNMSQAAKKILAALEEYSSPLNDAKRIPTPSLAPKRRCVGPTAAPPRRAPLLVPTTADLLKMRHVQLQESTSRARQLAIETEEQAPPPPVPARRTGKIVTKIKDRDKAIDAPAPAPPDLPSVALPITSLPTFDIDLPASKPSMDTKPSSTKLAYKFAPPTKVAGSKMSHSSSSSRKQTFLFSAPISWSQWVSSERKISVSTRTNRISECDSDSKYKDASKQAAFGAGSKSASFGGNFKPAPGSWECTSCLVRNQAGSSKCVACETPKEAPVSKSASSSTFSTGFGDTFKPAAGSWTCDSCLVVNKELTTSCAACETSRQTKKSGFGDKFKPAAGSWNCDSCMISNNASASKCAACETPKPSTGDNKKSGFGDQFKPPSDSWSCKECFVNNTANASKCVACDSPNPSKTAPASQFSFGDAFKPKVDSWSCKECYVSNVTNASKCIACETPKDGSIPAKKPSATFSFGIPSTAKPAIKAQTNGPSGPWKCGICLMSNAEAAQQCKYCDTLRPSEPVFAKSNFQFGLPDGGFKFGIDKTDGNITNGPSTTKSAPLPDKKPAFQFGIPPVAADKPNKTVDVVKPTEVVVPKEPFLFGIAAKKVEEQPAISTASSTQATNTSLPTFGVPAAKFPDPDTTSSTSTTSAPSTYPDTTCGAAPTARLEFSVTHEKSKPNLITGNSVGFSFGVPTSIAAPSVDAAVPSIMPTVISTVATTAAPNFTFGAPAQANSMFPAPAVLGSMPSAAPFDGNKTGFLTPQARSSPSAISGTCTMYAKASDVPASVGSFPAANSTSDWLAKPSTTPMPMSNPATSAFSMPTTSARPFAMTPATTPSFGLAATTTSSFGLGTPATPAFSVPTTNPFAASSAATPAFSFGASAPAFVLPTTTAATQNAFGAITTTSAFSASTTPAFGSSASTPFTFGTPNQNPPPYVPPMAVATRFESSTGGFGSMATPTPAFGSASATPSPAFGVNTPLEQPALTPSPFMFGAANSAPNPAAPPSFSLNVPSSFNFTGGQAPTFNAQPQPLPSAAGMERRRIIQAKRRSQR